MLQSMLEHLCVNVYKTWNGKWDYFERGCAKIVNLPYSPYRGWRWRRNLPRKFGNQSNSFPSHETSRFIPHAPYYLCGWTFRHAYPIPQLYCIWSTCFMLAQFDKRTKSGRIFRYISEKKRFRLVLVNTQYNIYRMPTWRLNRIPRISQARMRPGGTYLYTSTSSRIR